MSKNWLSELESRVQDAATRLRELRDENASLRTENTRLAERAEELEAELTQQGESSADADLRADNERLSARVAELENQLEAETTELLGQKGELEERVAELESLLAAATDPAADDWQQEREEIRERVSRLVDHLGQLLDE